MTASRALFAAALAVALASSATACSSRSNPSTTGAVGRPTVRSTSAVRSVQAQRTDSGQSTHPDLKSTCRVLSSDLALLTAAAGDDADADLSSAMGHMRDFERSAPAEIRPDIKVIADFDQRLLDAVSSGGSPAAIDETPQLSAALTHLASWEGTNCR
jgi:hypothetical protein